MNITTPFWFVWSPENGAPTHQHPSQDAAISEAERLARRHKGETFIVLESICARKVDDMRRIDFRHPVDNDLPF